MAMEESVSKILAGMEKELLESWNEQKGKKANFGLMELPPGIKNGVAKVTMVKFGTVEEGDNKGAPYYMAMASVVHPPQFAGVPIFGLYTKVMVVIKETKDFKTGVPVPRKRQYDKIMNEMRKMGVKSDESLLPSKIISTAALLQKRGQDGKLFVRFRTFSSSKTAIIKDESGRYWCQDTDESGRPKGKIKKGPYRSEEEALKLNPYAGKEPLVNHEWNGEVAWNPEEQNGTLIRDKSPVEDVPDDSGETGYADAEPKFEDQPRISKEAFDDGAEDLDELARIADDVGGEISDKAMRAAAKKKLNEIGLEAGMTMVELGAADTWADTVAAIRRKQGSGEETTITKVEDEDKEDVAPVVGKVVYYVPPGKRKAQPCEVLSIKPRKELATIKSQVDEKVYVDRAFDELRASDE